MDGETLVSGLAIGSVYALMGMSLLVVFKVTEILNFAQGQVGMVGAYVAIGVITLGGGLPLALVLAVGAATLLCLAIYRVPVRAMVVRGIGPFSVSIATFGIYLLVTGLAALAWGHSGRPFPSIVGDRRVSLLGLGASLDYLTILVTALIVAGVTYVYYTHTGAGLAARAIANDPVAAQLAGVDLGRATAVAWGLGGLISGVAAITVAPLTGVSVDMMFPYLLKGMVAAVIGGLVSVPGAILGGLLLGLSESVAGSLLRGDIRDSVAVVVLMVALLLRPEGLFGVYRTRKV